MPIVGGTGLRYLLEVAGTSCGYVASVEGGWGIAEVIEELAPTGVKKRPGPPRWGELQLRLDLPAARPVVDWIVAAWRGEVRARNVAVTTVDAESNAVRRREFRDVLLAATTIPTLDAAARELDFLTLRLLPRAAQTAPASGTVTAPTPATLRPWYGRLEFPGLDCTKVVRIDALTVRQAFGSATRMREWLEPGPLSFPNLSVTLHESSAGDWQRWFEDFVVQGHNDDTMEKTGTLTLAAEPWEQSPETVLARIGLFNVGIFHLKGPNETPTSPPHMVASLYCERMDFRL